MAFPAGATPDPIFGVPLKLTTIDIVGGIKCHICQLIFRTKKDFDIHYGVHMPESTNIVYTCVKCHKEMPCYPRFRDHCYVAHVAKDRYKCEICLKMFSKLCALHKHIDTLHKFRCPSCQKTFSSKKELRIHQIIHKNDESAPYKCLTCHEQIEDIDSCEVHIEDHCIFTYSCPICNEEIPNLSNTAEHLSTHFGTDQDYLPDQTFVDIPDDSSIDLIGGILCNQCDNIYKNRLEFDEHFKEQHADKELVYSCIICGKQFEKYILFGDHCYYHFTKDRFECEYCDKSFSRLSLLVLHVEAFHSGGGGGAAWGCGHCARSFGSEARLRQHMRLLHRTLTLTCDAAGCGQTFETPKDLKYHQRVHKTGPRCQTCGLQFTSLSACERHIHLHRKKLYSCPICNRSYAEKYLMIKHIPQHFSSVLHLCKVCGKVFNAKSRLVEHFKTHSEVRSHVCNICGKGFVKPSQLEQHMNIHTGLKPHKCIMCPKSFASYPNWAKHLRRMHNISNYKEFKKDNVIVESNKTNETQAVASDTTTENNNVLVKSGAEFEEEGIDLAQLKHEAELPFVEPLPGTNFTIIQEGCGGSGGSWPPREYGPDVSAVLALDEQLPHIDPLLTIRPPEAWEPVIAKIYQEFPILDTDIY